MFSMAGVVDPSLYGHTPENVYLKNGQSVIKQDSAKLSKRNIRKPIQTQNSPQNTVMKPADLISIVLLEDSIIDYTDHFKKGSSRLELLSGTIIIARLQETIDTRYLNVPFTAVIKKDIYTNQEQLFFNSGDKIIGDLKLLENNGVYRLELIPKKAIVKRLNDEIPIDDAVAIPADNEKLSELGEKDYSQTISNALMSDLWNISIQNTNLELADLAKNLLGIGSQKKKPIITINAGQIIMIKLGKRLSL